MLEIGSRTAAAIAGLLASALLWQPTAVSTDESGAPREAGYRDVYVAITLAGFRCKAISGIVKQDPSEYAVRCENDKRFRVYLTDDETVHVVDRSPGAGSAPLVHDDHGSRVVRSLFVIVNLSGFDCDEVVSFERGPRLHYRVWCQNDTKYQISVRNAGRLVVDRMH